MNRTKRRTISHLLGERGVDLVKRKLPAGWVVRELQPDYGLDLAHRDMNGPLLVRRVEFAVQAAIGFDALNG